MICPQKNINDRKAKNTHRPALVPTLLRGNAYAGSIGLYIPTQERGNEGSK